MRWPFAFVLAVGIVAFATMITLLNIYQPPETEAPKVVCIKERGIWNDGYGRVGWSGTCIFPNK